MVYRSWAVEQRGRRRAAKVQRWASRGSDVVTLVMVEGLGHAWSGGPPDLPFCDATGPDASAMLMRFVLRQWAQADATAASTSR